MDSLVPISPAKYELVRILNPQIIVVPLPFMTILKLFAITVFFFGKLAARNAESSRNLFLFIIDYLP